MKLFHEILLKYIIIDLAGHIDVGLDRFVKNIRLGKLEIDAWTAPNHQHQSIKVCHSWLGALRRV